MLFNLALALLSSLALAAPCEPVEVYENCVNSGQVAWTFDDGPYLWEQNVVDGLQGGHATFFLNGNNYGCIYDRADQIKALYNAGHTLGSHTWSHANLNNLDYNGVNDELARVEEAFIKILGVKPLYFRPPYGNYNDNVLKVLSDRGYKKLFMWNYDTGDANGDSSSHARQELDKVINSYPNPALILSHSTIQHTSADTVPYAVPKLKAKGYQLVSVDTCLGSHGEWPYQWVGQPQARDSTWKC